MKNLERVLGWLEFCLAVACVIALIAMFALGVATVFFRFVVESSLAFPEELIRYLFVWVTALGSAIAYRRNYHAAIGVVVDRLPGESKRIALLAATSAGIVFFSIMIYQGLRLTTRVVPQISPALEVSMAWVYAAIPAGGALLLVFALELFLRQVRLPASELAAGSQ